MADINVIKKSASKERSERISNGTWMQRGAVFQDKRKKERDKPKHKGSIYSD